MVQVIFHCILVGLQKGLTTFKPRLDLAFKLAPAAVWCYALNGNAIVRVLHIDNTSMGKDQLWTVVKKINKNPESLPQRMSSYVYIHHAAVTDLSRDPTIHMSPTHDQTSMGAWGNGKPRSLSEQRHYSRRKETTEERTDVTWFLILTYTTHSSRLGGKRCPCLLLPSKYNL